jgi:hypothetical protein
MCIFCSDFALEMTISPFGSWIWQNGHCRSIRNGRNSREPVWLCWKWVRNGVNRSTNQFCTAGGSLGFNREYSVEYSIGSAAANERLGLKQEYSWEYSLGSARGSALQSAYRLGSAWIWRACGSVVVYLWARGCAWSNSAESSGGACGLLRAPIKLILAPVSSYGWVLHGGMIKTCFGQLWKFGYLPKYFCFLTNGALIPIVGGRNHWWWLWNTQSG